MPCLDYNLQTATADTVERFSLCGEQHYGKVVDVYDGNTLKVAMRFDGQLRKFTVRLEGVNAPEVRPAQAASAEARAALQQLVGSRLVRVHCFNFDIYGRLLAEVYLVWPLWDGRKSVNELMIEAKHLT